MLDVSYRLLSYIRPVYEALAPLALMSLRAQSPYRFYGFFSQRAFQGFFVQVLPVLSSIAYYLRKPE